MQETLKVVVETPWVNQDFAFDMYVDSDEIEELDLPDNEDDANSALTMHFADTAWDVIRNNLQFHVERNADEYEGY